MAPGVRVTGSPPAGSNIFACQQRLNDWLTALEERHLANLRFPEVTRALRALSSAYVERRHAGGPRGALDSAGKRAAFALFYAPLHLLGALHVLHALGAGRPGPRRVIDLGCGTGTVGAAWALISEPQPSVLGVDRNAWAVAEARWTWTRLGLHGRSVVGDVSRGVDTKPGDAIAAGWVMNEMTEPARQAFESRLVRAAADGSPVLVLEPISRQATPWWGATAERFAQYGFEAREWRFTIERPSIVARLDDAAGLDHRTLVLRSLFRPSSFRP